MSYDVDNIPYENYGSFGNYDTIFFNDVSNNETSATITPLHGTILKAQSIDPNRKLPEAPDTNEKYILLKTPASSIKQQYPQIKYPTLQTFPLKKNYPIMPDSKLLENKYQNQNQKHSQPKTQISYINREPQYTTNKNSVDIKKCITLRWEFDGYSCKYNVKKINIPELTKMIVPENEKCRYCVREIQPVRGFNSMDGGTAHIYCETLPKFNSHIDFSGVKPQKTFVSLDPGVENFHQKKKKDLAKHGQVNLLRYLLKLGNGKSESINDSKIAYEAFISTCAKEVKRNYKNPPMNGEEWVKKLIQISKKIPEKQIKIMSNEKWIMEKATCSLSNKDKPYITITKPSTKPYGQFVTMSPYYSGNKRYFVKIDDSIPIKLQVEEHRKILDLLTNIKKQYGVLETLNFIMIPTAVFNDDKYSISLKRLANKPNVVSLKIKLWISVVKKRK